MNLLYITLPLNHIYPNPLAFHEQMLAIFVLSFAFIGGIFVYLASHVYLDCLLQGIEGSRPGFIFSKFWNEKNGMGTSFDCIWLNFIKFTKNKIFEQFRANVCGVGTLKFLTKISNLNGADGLEVGWGSLIYMSDFLSVDWFD